MFSSYSICIQNDVKINVIQRLDYWRKKKRTRNFPLCEVMRQSLYDFQIFFFPFIIFASPCILKKEVVSHDGTCRAIWEISDVTLIRSRLTKQGPCSNVIDAYECIREHCTPSPLGEHFNHRCGQQRWRQRCCYKQERDREGRERVKMRTDGMERNASWEKKKKNDSVRWCKRRFAFQFDMYRTFLARTLLWLFHIFSRGISNRFLNSYDPFDFFFFLCSLLSADLLN